jgi:hypothetical protein
MRWARTQPRYMCTASERGKKRAPQLARCYLRVEKTAQKSRLPRSHAAPHATPDRSRRVHRCAATQRRRSCPRIGPSRLRSYYATAAGSLSLGPAAMEALNVPLLAGSVDDAAPQQRGGRLEGGAARLTGPGDRSPDPRARRSCRRSVRHEGHVLPVGRIARAAGLAEAGAAPRGHRSPTSLSWLASHPTPDTRLAPCRRSRGS